MIYFYRDALALLLMPVLAQEFFQLLLERRAALEMVEDLEEDEQDGGERRGVDEPGGEPRGVGRGDFLRENQGEGQKVKGKGKRHGEFYIEIR